MRYDTEPHAEIRWKVAMRKYGIALVLVLAASCLADTKKPKLEKFIPPAQSHGMEIAGYGCDRQHVSDNPDASKASSFWSLLLWAQYGKEHKRYWQKTYDTFKIPVKPSVIHAGESAGTGAAIGAFSAEDYDFTSLDQACADWGAQVKSTLKIEANGNKVE
jgi:hypothetical protein